MTFCMVSGVRVLSWAMTHAIGAGAEVAQLIDDVTSPGGTTERAVRVFEQSGFRAMFEAAMDAAADRSRELAADAAAG